MNNNINPDAFFPDYTGYLGDLRLERRGRELWHKLSQHPSSSIRQLSKTRAEQKAYYRLLKFRTKFKQILVKYLPKLTIFQITRTQGYT